MGIYDMDLIPLFRFPWTKKLRVSGLGPSMAKVVTLGPLSISCRDPK